MTCAFCGGAADAWGLAYGRPATRCADCRSVSVAPAEGPCGDGSWSPVDHTRAGPSASRNLLASRAVAVRRMAPGRRLVDIGARDGTFVREARACGLAAEGLEPSASLRAEAARAGVVLMPGPVGSVAGDWDAATLWDVLTHEPDPAALVRAVRKLLVPGGLVAVSAPGARSARALAFGLDHPELDPAGGAHVHLATEVGLAALFDRAGMRLVKAESSGVPSLATLAGALDPRLAIPPGSRRASALGALDAIAAAAAEGLGLGDNLVAFARR